MWPNTSTLLKVAYTIKVKVLYGLYQSKNQIIKNDLCYLVEGYTDVISLHHNGVKNVVASSGTSLTEGRFDLSKGLPIILLFYMMEMLLELALHLEGLI